VAKYDAHKIARAIHQSHQQFMEPYRQVRTFAMEQFGGPWYGKFHADLLARKDNDKQPVSLLAQLQRTYMPNLCGSVIKSKVTSRRWDLRAQAQIRQLMLDHIARQIKLARTHRLVVQDALLGGLGIYRVGVCAGAELVKINGEYKDPGQFFASRVDLDDFARDPRSRDFMEDAWRAHRGRVSKEYALETGIWPNEIVENLRPVRDNGPEKGHSHEVGGSVNNQDGEICEQIEYWDVVIYDGTRVLEGTLSSLTADPQWLMELREFEGKEGGPYEFLSLIDQSNNVMPVSPAMQVMDLHLALARMGTKMVRKIVDAKSNYLAKKTAQDDAHSIQEAADEEVLLVDDPMVVNRLESAGVPPAFIQGFEWMRNEANNATANIQQMAGIQTAGGGDTATEKSILQGNANVTLADYRDRANDCLSRVIDHMGWDLENDPLKKQAFTTRLPGGESIDVVYDAATKQGAYEDFTYEAQAFSVSQADPVVAQRQFGMMMQTAPPFIQFVMATGGNVQAAIRIIAEKFETPELDEIYPTPEAMAMQQAIAALGQGAKGQGAVGMQPAGAQPGMQPGMNQQKPGGVRRVDGVQSAMAGAYT
jgi:hypothetical protein